MLIRMSATMRPWSPLSGLVGWKHAWWNKTGNTMPTNFQIMEKGNPFKE
jgi:hypothetical protein